jgi:hypothetical protein
MTARCFSVRGFVATTPMLTGAGPVIAAGDPKTGGCRHQMIGGAHTASLALLAAITVWPAAALAYRPFDTTDAAVAEKGEVELEVGPLHWLRAEGETLLIAPALVANFGVCEHWELVLEGKHLRRLNAGTTESRSALVDTALSAKGVLREGSLQGSRGPSVATELGLAA